LLPAEGISAVPFPNGSRDVVDATIDSQSTLKSCSQPLVLDTTDTRSDIDAATDQSGDSDYESVGSGYDPDQKDGLDHGFDDEETDFVIL
jgi:hypothetical protein